MCSPQDGPQPGWLKTVLVATLQILPLHHVAYGVVETDLRVVGLRRHCKEIARVPVPDHGHLHTRELRQYSNLARRLLAPVHAVVPVARDA